MGGSGRRGEGIPDSANSSVASLGSSFPHRRMGSVDAGMQEESRRRAESEAAASELLLALPLKAAGMNKGRTPWNQVKASLRKNVLLAAAAGGGGGATRSPKSSARRGLVPARSVNAGDLDTYTGAQHSALEDAGRSELKGEQQSEQNYEQKCVQQGERQGEQVVPQGSRNRQMSLGGFFDAMEGAGSGAAGSQGGDNRVASWLLQSEEVSYAAETDGRASRSERPEQQQEQQQLQLLLEQKKKQLAQQQIQTQLSYYRQQQQQQQQQLRQHHHHHHQQQQQQQQQAGRNVQVQAPGGGEPAAASHAAKPSEFVLRVPYEDISGRYCLSSRELGRGQFGCIRTCVELSSGRGFACKTISKKIIRVREDADDMRREVTAMSMLKGHPSIISLHEVLEDPKVRGHSGVEVPAQSFRNAIPLVDAADMPPPSHSRMHAVRNLPSAVVCKLRVHG